MFARRRKRQPRGVVAVLMVVSLFALVGFLALAIDLGMLAMTRAQLQDVSDAAAMAGCRALNGNTANNANNNYSAVAPRPPPWPRRTRSWEGPSNPAT